MTSTSLYSLAERLRVGDTIQWVGEKANPDRSKPKTVTGIEHRADRIRVEGNGPRGGQYAFWVDTDGNSKAIFIDPDTGEQDMGTVAIARLVCSTEAIEI